MNDPLAYLVEAASTGDDRAVAELVTRTQAPVLALCRRLGSVQEAEDLAQETYIRALRSLPAFRGEAPVLAWLLGIARHVCADHIRRSARRRRLAGRWTSPEPEGTDATYPLEMAELIGHLDPDQAEAFVLTQVVGFSYIEAAETCRCPVGTIRSRVARARAQMADALRQAQTG
ncbi:MAG: RNA polymerase sigma factor [Acidimicrobiales bacterium]